MMNTSLNIVGKIDPVTRGIYGLIDEVTRKQNINYIVVGATARDLVIHYYYDAPIERATTDIDFGIQVSAWEQFEELKSELLKYGFQETSLNHTLRAPSGIAVDIVPFGSISGAKNTIAWPPEDAIVMNVLGFQEAYDSACLVQIGEDPEIQIPVVTPIGLILLKLIAWTERPPEHRKRDALDIAYVLSNYEKSERVKNALYDSENISNMQRHDWDIELAASYLLGVEVNQIGNESTMRYVRRFLDGKLGS